LDNENVLTKDHKELAHFRNKKIGFIFQTFNLLPVLDVYENIEFPFMVAPNHHTASERKEIIMNIIKQVGLEKYVHHKSNELSGGQMQRVAIGRSLALNPSLVLADEPTANLDSVTSETILQLMKKLNDENNTTFLFATHDPLVLTFVNRTIRIKDGIIEKDICTN
jgi:putative ABC transport system ATP-binding protein